MDIKKLIKKILATAGVAVLVVAIIVGDVVCHAHEGEITSHLCPDKVISHSENTQESLEESDKVIQRVAEEGITLLKNNGTLPLDFSELDEEEKYNVNLFGVGGTDSDVNGFFVFGGGSGSVSLEKENAIFLKGALENAGFEVNKTLYNFFKEKGENPSVDWWMSEASKSYRNYAKVFSDTAIVTVSRLTGENKGDDYNFADLSEQSFSPTGFGSPWAVTYKDSDKDGRNFCQLSLKEEAMIKWCAENFENVIVLINSANVMELGLLNELDGVGAVMYVPYTGQSGANAIGKILKGEVNPSGKTTDTFAYSTTEYAPYYADALFTWNNGLGKSGYDIGGQIAYTEDIYIGYKWYETADKEGYFTAKGTTYDKVVQYPFGYGLTYTNFEWTVKSVSTKIGDGEAAKIANGDTITDKNTTIVVTVEVKNTGKVAGKEVVQLYTTAPYTKGGIEKPYVALTDFAKTKTLYPASEAGEDKPNSETLTLEFNLYDIASYDCYDKNGNGFAGWELESGEYTLSLRNNAHEVNACENANFNFKIGAGGFRYETDPKTGYKVENRFTGETAEAGVPTDGNNDKDVKITYLSRADFDGTFPKNKITLRTKGIDVTYDGINAYLDDSVVYKDLTMPTFGKDNGLYLYTREDGSKATIDDLNGTGQKTKINEELVMELGKDYDSPKWNQLLEQLTAFDAVEIVARCWCGTFAAESIGKIKDRVFDGPSGLTNTTISFEMLKDVSAFPCEALSGMTWDKDLLRKVGAAMGTEVSNAGTIGMYAPAIDVHRHPYNGRNYEQYGEDPVLVAKLGAKQVYGMTTHGVQASIKHFIISTSGRNPVNYNSWITEQNLRENYLKTFEVAVKEAGANFLMTSFNNIGGVKCATSYALNTEILRNEWGFKGSVITDYNVVTKDGKTTASLIRSGNDLRFQVSENNRKELDKTNAVDMALAVRAVKNSLYSFCNTYYRTKSYDPTFTTTSFTVIPAFNWWIPSLVAINIVIDCGFLFLCFWLWVKPLLGKKKVVVGDKCVCEQIAIRITEVKPKEENDPKQSVAANIPATVGAAATVTKKVESKAETTENDKAKAYLNAIKYYALAKDGKVTSDAEGNTVTIKSGDKVIVSLTLDGDNVKAEYPVGDKDKVEIMVFDSSSLGKALLFVEKA